MFNKKIITLIIIVFALFAVSAVSANDNVTDEGENYNAVIIAEDMSEEYDPSGNDIMFNIQDFDGNPIEDGEPAVTYDNKKIRAGYDSQHYYSKNLGTYVLDVDPNAGNHKVKIELNTSKYLAEPVSVNIKILKSTFNGNIKCKSYHGTDKDTLTMKAKVYDSYEDCYPDGYVIFKVNGKSYKVKTKNGVATKTIKIKKAGTYTYTAKFMNENYKSSQTGKAKLYVYSTSKKARTFNMGKYKVVLSTYKYKKLVKAKNTNKKVDFTVKTNKFIKQSYRDYSGFQKYTVKTVNARVLFNIAYGGKSGSQGAQPNKYCMRFTTVYQFPDSFSTPSITGYKISSVLNKLNAAKTIKW